MRVSKIDGSKINYYIEQNKKRKPECVAVSDQEWGDALDAYGEQMWEGVTSDMTTQEFWNLIFFCAMSFCRGMEYAEVKAGTREETFYPRY